MICRRVLLPDPPTPVTHVSATSGKRTSTSLRLCWLAPWTAIQPAGQATYDENTAADSGLAFEKGHELMRRFLI